MNISLLFKLVGVVAAFSLTFPAIAQENGEGQETPEGETEETAEEEAPALGIIFLKPPERPLLGSVTQPATNSTATTVTPAILPSSTLSDLSQLTEDVLTSTGNPELATFLRSVNLNVSKFGLSPQYRFTMGGANVNLPSSLQSNMQLNPIIFGAIDALNVVGTVTLERDFSITEVRNDSIIYNKIEIDSFSLEWAGIAFSGSGIVDVDLGGMLSGELDLTVTSWNDAVNLGSFIRGAQTAEIEILLSVLTSGDELTLPVSFENGVAKIGQMTIGTFPSIYR